MSFNLDINVRHDGPEASILQDIYMSDDILFRAVRLILWKM